MGFLEERFRRQFRPDGAGYRFVRRGREVAFSADEVEEFVAEWRRLWLNPLLWSGWLLIGVGGPWWLAARGFPPGAWTLGLLAMGFMVVTLVPSLLRPREAADARLPDEPKVEKKPSLLSQFYWVPIVLVMLLRAGLEEPPLTGMLALLYSLVLVVGAIRAWRAQRRGDELQFDRTAALIFGVPSVVGLALFYIYPERGHTAWIIAAMMLAAVLTIPFLTVRRLLRAPQSPSDVSA